MQANAVSHTASESDIRKQHTCMHAKIALCAAPPDPSVDTSVSVPWRPTLAVLIQGSTTLTYI